MPKIEMLIECPWCRGAGVYVGMAERRGAAVVCYQCKGEGSYNYKYEYEEFTGRKIRDDVKRVYRSGYGYVLAPDTVNFKGIGEIDLTVEGVSYEEFLEGKTPNHIEKLVCPLLADQGACHKINGFSDECDRLDGGMLLGRSIKSCNYYGQKDKCWKRFRGELR